MSKQNSTEPVPKNPYWPTLLLFVVFIALTIWAAKKWDTVWVERSATFFPPEIQQKYDTDELAWKYPVYRSNDTYQWVHLADSIAEGKSDALRYRTDEGPPEGRPNAWHSGLAHLLHIGGVAYAKVRSWPAERGIHDLAHWIGPALFLAFVFAGSLIAKHLYGMRAGLIFAVLAFFSPALRWDFEFSRIDHESIFQIGLLLQLSGIAALLYSKNRALITWSLIASVGTALCWWVSATMQAAIGALTVLSFLICFARAQPNKAEPVRAKPLLIWGLASALISGLLILFDQKPVGVSINALHPIHMAAQIGAGLFCAAFFIAEERRRKLFWLLGLILGTFPLVWIMIHGDDAHIWMSPFMRRLHHHIIEFQSPWANGLWNQWETLSTLLLVILAGSLFWQNNRKNLFLPILALGLFALSIYQTRWLGLCAAICIISLAQSNLRSTIRFAGCLLLAAALSLTWLKKWVHIEENPGRLFVADMILKVAARDINLSLSELIEDNSSAIVAMPFAFAANSALFDKVHPLGTFYWENDEGLEQASKLFSTNAGIDQTALIEQNQFEYVVVQDGRMGAPFAKLTAWASLKDDSYEVLDQSLAWRLSIGDYPEKYHSAPFLGTFSPDKFQARIYRVK